LIILASWFAAAVSEEPKKWGMKIGG
jgi:hypothetical protein